ncbi:MAG: tRNA (guanosine(37)-N1)-methyltransferase TrmD [Bacilli bacterium]
MKINVLTLFPEMFESFMASSILKRAIDNGYVEINLYNFRDYSLAKNKSVDDTSYGGGPGMVLQVEPIHRCLSDIEHTGEIIAFTPTGKILDDKLINKLACYNEITLVCGHYEGFDERVYNYVDQEISIGDFILTGGETASFVFIDALIRKVPGVINKQSLASESFANGILDYPVYAKPICYDNHFVPDILLSGNHNEIQKYRYEMALKKTYERRKDLIKKYHSSIDLNILKKIIKRNRDNL